MKPVTERDEKDLAYTDGMHFTEALLEDPKVATGTFDINMSNSTWEGKINLNMLTVEINRYVSAKIAYTEKPSVKNIQQAVINLEIAYDGVHPHFELPAEIQKAFDDLRAAYKELVKP